MVQAYGLHICHAAKGDCGRYVVPGSSIEHDYAGVVKQSFNMRLGEHMSFTLTGMRIIDHPFALFLLGVDIMCGGRQAPSTESCCGLLLCGMLLFDKSWVKLPPPQEV